MVRRRVSAVSNHGPRILWPILRDAAKAPLPKDEDILVATNLELEFLRFIRFPHV